jgi:hypothetical protein
MRRLLPLLMPLIAFAAGCAQTESVSVVAADGTVQRKVSVTIDNSSNPMAGEENVLKPSTLIKFNAAAGWKSEEKKGEKGQDILTGARTIKPGESLESEFTLSDGSEGSLASCAAKAEKTADGLIVYTETWTWKGEIKESGTPIEKLQSVIDEKLSPWGVSESDRKTIAASVRRKSWRALFGPGDPLLGILLTNPNQGVRKLNNIVAEAFLQAMEPISGKSHAEKVAVVKEMVNGLDTTGMTAPEPPAGEAEPNSDMMVSILSRVKGPGQVVDHNGEMDILEDEVFWSMYLEASMVEPVVLKAVFRP